MAESLDMGWLASQACPSTGGWGGNTGVADVIAWKPDVPTAEAAGQLAAVMAGLLSRSGA
jgi:hypothetical protein